MLYALTGAGGWTLDQITATCPSPIMRPNAEGVWGSQGGVEENPGVTELMITNAWDSVLGLSLVV